jgi:isopropylmalate/homocitrate/citramalate synthase/4-hydroxybenzoate polyprenyltransferase
MMLTRKLMAHVETWRPYTSFYAGLLALGSATVVNGGLPAPGRALLVFIVPTLGWLAGLYGCDYFDRELDKVQKAHRPIPSGRISDKEAFACMMACMYLGLVGAAHLGFANIVLSGGCMAASVGYALVAKGRAITGNLMRGIPAAFTVLFGAAAVGVFPFAAGRSSGGVWALVALFLLHDMTTNLVGAVRDVEGDREGGYATVPVRHGVRTALRISVALLVSWELMAAFLPVWLPLRGRDYYAAYGLSLLFALAGIGTLARDPANRRGALRAHECFVIERMILSGALIAAGSGLASAALITLPLVAIAQWAQKTLRARHEFGAAAATAGSGTTATTAAVTTAAAAQVDVEGFIDTALDRLASDARTAGVVRRWDRRCEIVLTDRAFTARFEARQGQIHRMTAEALAAGTSPLITIRSSTRVFAQVFIERSSSAVAAYARGEVQLECSPLDMLRLSRLFNLILAATAAAPARAAEPRITAVSDEAPAPAKRRVVVADTTLRDGEQMPGVSFSPEQKVALAAALERIGVPLLEVGYPAVSVAEREAIRRIVDRRSSASIQVISRPIASEIDLAAETGCDSIALFIGTSDIHLQSKLRISRDELCRIVEAGVRHARRYNVQVAFAPEDATRTDRELLIQICRVALDAGAEVLGLPDTVGVMTPAQMRSLIADATAALPVPIAVHCHDDFGLATANSLAAVEAGAAAVQCSLAGIGERAGNAPLEEVACALELQLGYATGLTLAQLQPATELLQRFLPFPIAPNKAIVGANAFSHESGLHTVGIIRDPSTYEPFDPALVGGGRRFVFGKHSGRTAIAHVLADADHAVDEVELDRLVQLVKTMGDQGKSLSAVELVQMARSGHG